MTQPQALDASPICAAINRSRSIISVVRRREDDTSRGLPGLEEFALERETGVPLPRGRHFALFIGVGPDAWEPLMTWSGGGREPEDRAYYLDC